MTPAQKKWVREAIREPNGELHYRRPTYDMAGKLRDAGLFEIIDKPGSMGWPYSGWHLKVTDAGRAAVAET